MSETNWWLLYKTGADGVVVAFAELLRLDDRCLLRTGKPLTWGLNEELADLDDAGLEATLQRLQDDGFVVQRRWCFAPLVFEARRLFDELLIGARTTFLRLRAQHPGLNAFALQTDDSAMTIAALADTIEHRDAHDDDDDDEAQDEAHEDLRFMPSEWREHDDGVDLDIAYRLILSQHRDDVSLVGFDDFKAAFDAVVVDVLVALADEGVFGPVDARVVLYDVTDSEVSAVFVRAWSRLNDPALLAAFSGLQ